jgi:hypothetical protein
MNEYHRLIYDTAVWGINEIASNLGLKVQTIRDYRQTGVLCPEDGRITGRPWWYAGTVRRWAIETGRMTREGVAQPGKPSGRPRGSRSRETTVLENICRPGHTDVGGAVMVESGRYRGRPGRLVRWSPVDSGTGLTRNYAVVKLEDGREVRVVAISPYQPPETLDGSAPALRVRSPVDAARAGRTDESPI